MEDGWWFALGVGVCVGASLGGWVLLLPPSGLRDLEFSFYSMVGVPVRCCGCSITFLLWLQMGGVARLGLVLGVHVWQLLSGSDHSTDLDPNFICAMLLYRSMCFDSSLCVI